MTHRLLSLLGLCSLLGTAQLHADAASHRAAAETLLNTLHIQTQITRTLDELRHAQEVELAQLELDPAALSIVTAYQEKILALIGEEMTWEKLRDAYLDIYTEHFSEADMHELTTFFQSPAGQKFITTIDAITQATTRVSQARMIQLTPHFERLNAELQAELARLPQPQH